MFIGKLMCCLVVVVSNTANCALIKRNINNIEWLAQTDQIDLPVTKDVENGEPSDLKIQNT